MGLQITMRANWKDVQGEVCGDFRRDAYHHLVVITGMRPDKVAEEGWSQLVDKETARRIAEIAGLGQMWAEVMNPFSPGSYMIRVTIA